MRVDEDKAVPPRLSGVNLFPSTNPSLPILLLRSFNTTRPFCFNHQQPLNPGFPTTSCNHQSTLKERETRRAPFL